MPQPRVRLTRVPQPRVRLTRRGRAAVVVAAVAGALALAWLAGVASGLAAAGGLSSGGVAAATTSVVVRPGQTLWSIALHAQPAADPRAVVQEIVSLNALHSVVIQPGQRLRVPGG
ncbi:MAG TPA: LysM peptidoglycan-binding domain-containing protein [Streptosporangiaceae bacterium]|nr:LysM peptidoglycan-binding domain-containing protein [Streptosporangiaceae bacterium]